MECFKSDVVNNYHKSLPLEDFLKTFGSSHWPANDRTGYCYRARSGSSDINDCQMKYGNPFGPFWDDLGVNFSRLIILTLLSCVVC